VFGNVSEISSRETGVMEELFLEILIDSNSEERGREWLKRKESISPQGKNSPFAEPKLEIRQ